MKLNLLVFCCIKINTEIEDKSQAKKLLKILKFTYAPHYDVLYILGICELNLLIIQTKLEII